MSGHRGTTPERHPQFLLEGRPRTPEEEEAMARARITSPPPEDVRDEREDRPDDA